MQDTSSVPHGQCDRDVYGRAVVNVAIPEIKNARRTSGATVRFKTPLNFSKKLPMVWVLQFCRKIQ
jgi:hypothetical protein